MLYIVIHHEIPDNVIIEDITKALETILPYMAGQYNIAVQSAPDIQVDNDGQEIIMTGNYQQFIEFDSLAFQKVQKLLLELEEKE